VAINVLPDGITASAHMLAERRSMKCICGSFTRTTWRGRGGALATRDRNRIALRG